MRMAKVYNFGEYAGNLVEIEKPDKYKFIYYEKYEGPAVSLTMPKIKKEYDQII